MKYTFYIAVLITALVASSCRKSDDDDNPTPTQTIITSDSSNATGRLYVDVFDVNGNEINQATVSLYISYTDLQKSLPLYTFTSNNNGRVDFGFVLQGNYYLTGSNANGTLRDTTVAQVLPQRSIFRKLILR
ncbi:MAG: hypothetical protein MUE96_10345 [Bacteroidia bacterium]|jgi:hypothetical protein|nr:hypothetical protein [Bacteroidia bacterium]